MPANRRIRGRWKWAAALAIVPLGAVAYQSLEPERLDPEDLLPPDAERDPSIRQRVRQAWRQQCPE